VTGFVGERVVVLGASMAGLLAARVLSERFSEVLLVDRDELTNVTGYRRGVPHGRHAHGLISKGQEIVESHFPGVTKEIIDAGVKAGDFSNDVQWYFNGKRLRPSMSGLLCVPATRPVLEYHIRERTRKIPNVIFRDGCDILGLTSTPDRRTVTGVRIRPQTSDDTSETILADLVIDATGRGSRTPAWLQELGYERPEEERVKIGLAYTTRHFRLDTDPLGTDLAIIPAPTPAYPRGAFFYRLPGDDNRFELSLTGMLGDHPPTDPEGFLAFTKSLPVPEIFEAVSNAEPLDDPVAFSFPASVCRHYERLASFPGRLLVMGDAMCSFNPIYGQGMTVTAMESLTLGNHLRGGEIPQPLDVFRGFSRDVSVPWNFSAGADLGFPGVEGKRTTMTRIANAYVARLQSAAVQDSVLTNAFIRTAGLVDPPQSIMRPGNVIRVLRGYARSAS
jgi:2-polyprenyl-6-methoxyphenol hydroxylase-like FAD-dependent oxidoreductase